MLPLKIQTTIQRRYIPKWQNTESILGDKNMSSKRKIYSAEFKTKIIKCTNY